MQRGFTLIELLVVIAILGVLSTAVVLVINPAELLKQGRDATRLSDLATLETSLALFQADRSQGSLGAASTTYLSIPDTSPTCANTGLTPPPGWTYHCVSTTTLAKTDGTGWIPVNFNLISVGSPLSKLPIDPTDTVSSGLYYTYTTNGFNYELNSFMESQRYLQQSAAADNGDDGYVYENGSNLHLASYLPRGSVVVSKNPSQIKLLIAEAPPSVYYPSGASDLTNYLTGLGFTNIVVATSVSTVQDVAAYSPDIVVSFTSAWSTGKSSLWNQLYDSGYRIWSEGNDDGSSLYPIGSSSGGNPCAGTINPIGDHPINSYWTTTPNSGCDGRQLISVVNPNAFALGEDMSLGYYEVIYLEQTGKGRWFLTQPNQFPNGNLLKNAIFYMMR